MLSHYLLEKESRSWVWGEEKEQKQTPSTLSLPVPPLPLTPPPTPLPLLLDQAKDCQALSLSDAVMHACVLHTHERCTWCICANNG